eukprot:SAG22_NODE_1363_length_4612_cov_2.100377_5_plen_37_part_00
MAAHLAPRLTAMEEELAAYQAGHFECAAGFGGLSCT